MSGRHRSTAPSALATALLPRRAARHAKPGTVAPAVAAGGMTAVMLPALATSASAATSSDFSRLRACESGGNYRANTGNGYYGAYQFDARTWRGLGYSGMPHQASPGTQDAAARELQADRGWSPWPGCARKLGLGSSRGSSSEVRVQAAPRPAEQARARASRSGTGRTAPPRVFVAPAPTKAPTFFATSLTTVLEDVEVLEVEQWQARMVARGWHITVDGRFGPQTAALAERFATEKKIPFLPGTLDKPLFDAAWTLKVT